MKVFALRDLLVYVIIVHLRLETIYRHAHEMDRFTHACQSSEMCISRYIMALAYVITADSLFSTVLIWYQKLTVYF